MPVQRHFLQFLVRQLTYSLRPRMLYWQLYFSLLIRSVMKRFKNVLVGFYRNFGMLSWFDSGSFILVIIGMILLASAILTSNKDWFYYYGIVMMVWLVIREVHISNFVNKVNEYVVPNSIRTEILHLLPYEIKDSTLTSQDARRVFIKILKIIFWVSLVIYFSTVAYVLFFI